MDNFTLIKILGQLPTISWNNGFAEHLSKESLIQMNARAWKETLENNVIGIENYHHVPSVGSVIGFDNAVFKTQNGTIAVKLYHPRAAMQYAKIIQQLDELDRVDVILMFELYKHLVTHKDVFLLSEFSKKITSIIEQDKLFISPGILFYGQRLKEDVLMERVSRNAGDINQWIDFLASGRNLTLYNQDRYFNYSKRTAIVQYHLMSRNVPGMDSVTNLSKNMDRLKEIFMKLYIDSEFHQVELIHNKETLHTDISGYIEALLGSPSLDMNSTSSEYKRAISDHSYLIKTKNENTLLLENCNNQLADLAEWYISNLQTLMFDAKSISEDLQNEICQAVYGESESEIERLIVERFMDQNQKTASTAELSRIIKVNKDNLTPYSGYNIINLYYDNLNDSIDRDINSYLKLSSSNQTKILSKEFDRKTPYVLNNFSQNDCDFNPHITNLVKALSRAKITAIPNSEDSCIDYLLKKINNNLDECVETLEVMMRENSIVPHLTEGELVKIDASVLKAIFNLQTNMFVAMSYLNGLNNNVSIGQLNLLNPDEAKKDLNFQTLLNKIEKSNSVLERVFKYVLERISHAFSVDEFEESIAQHSTINARVKSIIMNSSIKQVEPKFIDYEWLVEDITANHYDAMSYLEKIYVLLESNNDKSRALNELIFQNKGKLIESEPSNDETFDGLDEYDSL